MTEFWNRYGPTAARAAGKRGCDVRPQSITFDCHAHVMSPRAFEFAKPHLDMMTIPAIKYASPDTRAINMKQDGERFPLMLPKGYDERLAHLDAMGIDKQLVMSPPPQCYINLPLEIAVPGARLVNDDIAEFVAGKPERFAALGTVPMQDGNEAAKELEYCIKTLGFKGVQILPNVGDREISHPDFEPFWAKAEELGAAVLLHPIGFTDGRRLTPYYFNNVIGNPFETALAVHYLIFDGVLERHPKLKIIAVHGGGYLGAYWGRIDHAWGAREDAHAKLPKPPTAYLKQVYVDTIVFTAPQLRALIDLFGADHVMMGSDYPYDMGDYEPVEHVMSSGLDEATAKAVLGGTAQRVLGM